MNALPHDPQDSQGLSQALLSLARNRSIQPELITQLRHDSEPFREICADYEECCTKLTSLGQTGKAETVGDYEEMRDQLEHDLLRCLQQTSVRRDDLGRDEAKTTGNMDVRPEESNRPETNS